MIFLVSMILFFVKCSPEVAFIDFTERRRDRNIDVREKHRSVTSSTCPNQGLNPQPSGVWDNTPTK